MPWILLLFWLAAAAAIAFLWVNAVLLYRGDLVLPGVRSMGQELGGRRSIEAAELLRSNWLNRRVQLVAGDKSWTLSPEELGFSFDAEGTARLAHDQGRAPAVPQEGLSIARQILAYAGTKNAALSARLVDLDPRLAHVQELELDPIWTFDRAKADRTVRTLAAQIEVTPQDAGVQVVDGQVEVTPASTGRALDVATALAAIAEYGDHLAQQAAPPSVAWLNLPVVTLRPVVTDVSSVVQDVSPLLESPIPVALWDPIRDERYEWSIPPEDLGRWLAFRVAEGDSSRIEWSVDETRVAEFLKQQEMALGNERYLDRETAIPSLVAAFKGDHATVKLRLFHNGRTHTVQSGETLSSIAYDSGMPYPWIQAANRDLGDNLSVGQQIAIPSQDALLPLDPVEHKRIKVSITDQRVKAFEDGELVWDWPASTGLPTLPTSPGVFQVQSHEKDAYAANWDLHMPYFMGIYQAVPGQEFMNGFHGFPSKNNQQLLWTKNLGKPVTYGCILLSTENAALLYDWAPEGVIVEIEK